MPDGLAAGLLAGVNPIAGLYAYLYGTVGGALFTSSSFMAVQATGAMAIIVADVDLASRDDPARSLFTLSILTGVVMIIAGVLRFGQVLRFVSNSVMTGFITAVGINIVLGQLDTFTGYEANGDNRVLRAFDLLLNLGEVHLATLAVGITTLLLIVILQKTPLGALGLVVGVAGGSILAAILAEFDVDVALISNIADVPSGLPFITAPLLSEIAFLLIPALSLAFVGIVQGAGVSAGFPDGDGAFPDDSQDFVGQGTGNVLAGLFQGMPVGGSMSGSSLIVISGARTRAALLFAGAVMMLVVLFFAPLVDYIAMPALAALLIVVGIGTVKPDEVMAVARTGHVQLTVMSGTLILTLIIPLQYAVLVGVAISIILFVVRQSGRLVTKRMLFEDDGRRREVDPPSEVPPNEVIVLRPYGSMFFASARLLEEQMPTVVESSVNSVVILRLRGADDAGSTLIDVLSRYSTRLTEADCKLVLVTDNPRIRRQFHVTGAIGTIGDENIYTGTEWVGETARRAYEDGLSWVNKRAHPPPKDSS